MGWKNSENCTFRFRKLYVSFSRLYTQRLLNRILSSIKIVQGEWEPNLTFCFPTPCIVEFTSSLRVCFERGLFELVRTFPSSFFVKIRMSRAQKQISFAFCRGEVSTTKSKILSFWTNVSVMYEKRDISFGYCPVFEIVLPVYFSAKYL